MQYLYGGLIGLLSGITSGLFGVGGGIVMVPAMLFLLPIANIKMAIGTSLAVIIPTSIMGTVKHHQQGYVDWKLVAMLVPMAIVGSYAGAWLMHQIPAMNLKRAFGGFLVLVGLRLLLFR